MRGWCPNPINGNILKHDKILTVIIGKNKKGGGIAREKANVSRSRNKKVVGFQSQFFNFIFSLYFLFHTYTHLQSNRFLILILNSSSSSSSIFTPKVN
jgi:hypothetical protein